MKLIIMIPCLNEADQLADTMATLPAQLPGVDVIETLVIDDGSTDATAEVARAAGADHVLRNPNNLGLAKSYIIGLEHALLLGADVIVNFDADNQYPATFLPDLIAPILHGRADLVVGARPMSEIEHFSPVKRTLQHVGTWVVRQASGGLDVTDATSGFRAVSKRAAIRLYTFSSYSYTLETLIQAGRMNIAVASVPIKVNPPTRPSRLMRSMWGYIARSTMTILRIGFVYYPLRFFFWSSIVVALPGLLAILRFLVQYAQGDGAGHLQSLILGTGLFAAGVVLLIGGVLADLVAANRVLLQELRSRALEEKILRTVR
ncbi:glycosyltransferase [Rhodobacteraceae bacterium 2CG4]|uniref:Glycosyltransferase n=1 Tax=Halovulum marinum TaxID=2662447 RepID=A0A6L5Z663_9RHOB|nr:glycosyltransferase family 2 protein [Halovulum marinum]MSU91534.1 glycosyltransferase [Halovulum marinum]